MYPNECCKIQPSDENDIPTHYNHIMQSYHHIMTYHFGRGHEYDNITYNIIPFVSMLFYIDYCFLHHSPATSIGILLYLKYDKMKINQIKVIPH